MIRTLALSLFLGLVSLQTVHASPEVAARHMENPSLVGEARLKFLFWKVYDAELYAPDGVWNEAGTFALTFDYLRKISSEDISKRMVKEMRGQGFTDDEILDDWYQISLSIFPDVEKGTRITGVRDANGHALFYLGSEPIGKVEDPVFTDWFFRIWLGEKTSVPKFRAKLIGEKS